MWLADTLSRAPLPREQAQVDSFEVFVTENIQITSKPKRITDHTHSVIQRVTQDDPILSRIIPYIQHGWPDKRTAVERNLANYWTFRWELAYIDGVLYKGDKIIIPTAMRRRMLEKIHAAHQGVEKSILRIAAPPAHPTVIPTDIEVTTSATRYHPVPVPTPTTQPIDEAQVNSQTDHEHVEPELATPSEDNSPHASLKIIRLPAISSKVNVSSPLKQQDTRRQFYTTRSGRESKPPKRYE